MTPIDAVDSRTGRAVRLITADGKIQSLAPLNGVMAAGLPVLQAI